MQRLDGGVHQVDLGVREVGRVLSLGDELAVHHELGSEDPRTCRHSGRR